jgi:regulatory protein
MTLQENVQAAKELALKALAGRDYTRQEMREHLVRKRISPAVIEATVLELEASGLIDDRKLAENYVRLRLENEQSQPSRLELEVTLEERGIDSVVLDPVLKDAFADRDEQSDALELARVKVRTSPARLAPDAIRRRVYAYLVRRGYDEETCRWAVETAADEYLGRA